MADDTPPIRLVLTYIEAAQRARTCGNVDDFEALREFLAPDVVIKAASPWTDEPWGVIHRGADAVIARLQAPINKSTSLTTENVTVQQAGEERVRRADVHDRRWRRHPRQHGVPHLFGGRWCHHRRAGLPQRARDPRWLKPGQPLMPLLGRVARLCRESSTPG
jgi:ketosteroid isomerase-like protein